MTKPIHGWVEILLRKTPIQQICDWASIQATDYFMPVQPIPFKELNTVYDAYRMWSDNAFEDMPRAPAYGDLLNLCIYDPDIVSTYVLQPFKMRGPMVDNGPLKTSGVPGYPLRHGRIPVKFPSFHKNATRK